MKYLSYFLLVTAAYGSVSIGDRGCYWVEGRVDKFEKSTLLLTTYPEMRSQTQIKIKIRGKAAAYAGLQKNRWIEVPVLSAETGPANNLSFAAEASEVSLLPSGGSHNRAWTYSGKPKNGKCLR